jgi:hypothetical protein
MPTFLTVPDYRSMKPYLLLSLLFLPGILLAQSTDKYMKVLFRDSATLYFVKPLDFKSQEIKVRLEADFTYNHYRYPSAKDSLVVMNFTLKSKDPIRDLESVQLGTQAFAIPGEAIQLFYIEQEKGDWYSRNSLSLPYSQFKMLLQQGEKMPVVVQVGPESHRFTGHKDWAKMSAACLSVFP